MWVTQRVVHNVIVCLIYSTAAFCHITNTALLICLILQYTRSLNNPLKNRRSTFIASIVLGFHSQRSFIHSFIHSLLVVRVFKVVASIYEMKWSLPTQPIAVLILLKKKRRRTCWKNCKALSDLQFKKCFKTHIRTNTHTNITNWSQRT